MTKINKLSGAIDYDPSDLLIVDNGKQNRISVNNFFKAVYNLFTSKSNAVSQFGIYVNAIAFQILSTSNDVWLILQAPANFTSCIISLPPSSVLVNNQEITITFHESITALSILPNGAGLANPPTSAVATKAIILKYLKINNNWLVIQK